MPISRSAIVRSVRTSPGEEALWEDLSREPDRIESLRPKSSELGINDPAVDDFLRALLRKLCL
jgi:hypothetical protein